MKKEILLGNEFMSKVGKKHLRPSGKKGTEFIIEKLQKKFGNNFFTILEISCNRGETVIEIAKHFNCKAIGVDGNPKAIQDAKKRILSLGMEKKVEFFQMKQNDLKFHFEFDVIINQCMLCMTENKNFYLLEDHKYLKNDGILFLNEICYKNLQPEDDEDDIKNPHMTPHPLSIQNWKDLFKNNYFWLEDYYVAKFTLFSFKGLMIDEGIFRTLEILRRAKLPENYQQFFKMRKFYFKNKKNLGSIVCVLHKINHN